MFFNSFSTLFHSFSFILLLYKGTHVFRIKPWPSSIVQFGLSAIHNFNVRGRRGNIVDVYPAVEYDFVGSGLEGSKYGEIAQYDHLHIQWCGSDANPQGQCLFLFCSLLFFSNFCFWISSIYILYY